MNGPHDSETRYLSYMLRMWHTRDGAGQPVWCASLEEPGSHQTAGFGDMGAMFAFLQRRLGLVPPGAPAPEEPPPGGRGSDSGLRVRPSRVGSGLGRDADPSQGG